MNPLRFFWSWSSAKAELDHYINKMRHGIKLSEHELKRLKDLAVTEKVLLGDL